MQTELIHAPPTVTTVDMVDTMSVGEMVRWLRERPNPDTGKAQHSLSEIGYIAGASKGWADYVLKHPQSVRDRRGSSYESALKRYIKRMILARPDLANPKPDSRIEDMTPRRRPREEVERRRHIEQEVVRAPAAEVVPEPKVEPPPKMEVPAPKQPEVRAAETEKVVTQLPTGARIVTVVARQPKTFNERFEALKARLWDETSQMEELAMEAPPIFRPGVEKVRDRLIEILADLG